MVQWVAGRHPVASLAVHTGWPGPDCCIALPSPPLQIDLESGHLLDSHTIERDYVELARNQGAHLRGQLLLVLGVSLRAAAAPAGC